MPKVSIPPRYSPAWFVQVAEEMVRNGSDLKTAALDLGLELEVAEAACIARRKDFQEILRGETNKYHAMVANDPSRTKSVALGIMWIAAEKLAKEGEHDKAVQALERIAKVEGWSGNEQNINIFSGLTARDIEEAKARLAKSTPVDPKGTGKSLPN
jgi:hypothetical protein